VQASPKSLWPAPPGMHATPFQCWCLIPDTTCMQLAIGSCVEAHHPVSSELRRPAATESLQSPLQPFHTCQQRPWMKTGT